MIDYFSGSILKNSQLIVILIEHVCFSLQMVRHSLHENLHILAELQLANLLIDKLKL